MGKSLEYVPTIKTDKLVELSRMVPKLWGAQSQEPRFGLEMVNNHRWGSADLGVKKSIE